MKFIKTCLLLVLLSACSHVAVATVALESEQWAMVVLGFFLVGIQATRSKRAAEPLGLDN